MRSFSRQRKLTDDIVAWQIISLYCKCDVAKIHEIIIPHSSNSPDRSPSIIHLFEPVQEFKEFIVSNPESFFYDKIQN